LFYSGLDPEPFNLPFSKTGRLNKKFLFYIEYDSLIIYRLFSFLKIHIRKGGLTRRVSPALQEGGKTGQGHMLYPKKPKKE
jgi:hypothetical protein